MGLIEPGSESFGAMAAGTLDPVFRLMLETRAQLDTRSAAAIPEADLIGAAFFERADAVPTRNDALDAVMRRIDEAAILPSGSELPGYLDGLPPELCCVAGEALAQGGWITVDEGVRILSLQVPFSTVEQNGGNVFLVEMEPGSGVDRHRHVGEEYTLVLKGAVAAEDEDAMSVGSLLLRKAGSIHTPEAAGDELCAMLVILTGGVEYVPQDGDQISA